MGYYLNPPEGKEAWLAEHGKPANITECKLAFHSPAARVPVCLVDNGWMTAAGIAFDERELEAFTDPSDERPKRLFLVPRHLIVEQCPAVERALQH